MPPTKTIVGFFVRLSLLYALLVAPWPGLREAYVAAHASAANAFFRSAREHGTVRFIAMGAVRRAGHFGLSDFFPPICDYIAVLW